MNVECAGPTDSAYEFPLLIRCLLHSGVSRAPEQEIVYADKKRLTYREFAERVSRLAAGLTALGVKAGDTVAVMDWDTHRYLECFFAVPWLTQGYLKDAENSENLWKGGWLHTGDIAVVEPSGYVKITDRLKDVIKTGGEWVSSLDLENLIVGMPGVAEAAVIGVPHPKWGERPLAIVAANPGRVISAADIKARLADFAARGIISRYAVAERVVILESLPKTSVGKLDKKVLRAKYGLPPI